MRFPGGGAQPPPPPPEPTSTTVVVDKALVDEAQAAVLELMRRPESPIQFDSLVGEGNANTQTALRVEIGKVLARHKMPENQRPAAIEAIVHEMRGYGPLEPLFKLRDQLEEIMVNGPDQVIVVYRGGRIEQTGVRFRSEEQLRFVAQRLLAPVRRRVTEADPIVDASLPGMRLNVVLAPIAVVGTSISIRFHHKGMSAKDLVQSGMIGPEPLEFLQAAVQGGISVLVSGGTATGKTTFLNALSHAIPPDQRIVTVEDAIELDLRAGNVVSLETRPANVEGKGEITIRRLVKNALRMRPDWIIVGEVRDASALDVANAGNSGHSTMCTVHANSAEDALRKLATYAAMSDEHLTAPALLPQIATAFQLVVQLRKFPGGRRRVVQITEVTGVDFQTSQVITNDLFVHRGGFLQYTGYRPDSLIERMREQDVRVQTLRGEGEPWEASSAD